MRSHLDLNAVKVTGEVFLLKYETKNQFKVFDSLFGAYSRYGSSQNRPGIGKTLQVEEYHHMYSMGSGLDDAFSNVPVSSLSKKNSKYFGVDLRYNTTTSDFEIVLRYELRAVTNNVKILQMIEERTTYNGKSMSINLVSFSNEKYNATIKKNAYFQYNGCTFKILDDYVPGATFGACVVTSTSTDCALGSTEILHYELIHKEVIRFLESMMEF